MVIGVTVDMQMMKASDEDAKDSNKEANLLCGDCIVNYKTVQSFGNEEQLVNLYRDLLMPVHKAAMSKGIKSGAAFGCSQIS
jgi:ABC-type transport system involved in Fe-S cluster assembly fused permease/ATPase subunit